MGYFTGFFKIFQQPQVPVVVPETLDKLNEFFNEFSQRAAPLCFCSSQYYNWYQKDKEQIAFSKELYETTEAFLRINSQTLSPDEKRVVLKTYIDIWRKYHCRLSINDTAYRIDYDRQSYRWNYQGNETLPMLAGFDLSRADLAAINFSGLLLLRVNLQAACFKRYFGNAYFEQCNLTKLKDITGGNGCWHKSHFKDCNFTDSDLSGVTIAETIFEGCSFIGTRFNKSNHRINIHNCLRAENYRLEGEFYDTEKLLIHQPLLIKLTEAEKSAVDRTSFASFRRALATFEEKVSHLLLFENYATDQKKSLEFAEELYFKTKNFLEKTENLSPLQKGVIFSMYVQLWSKFNFHLPLKNTSYCAVYDYLDVTYNSYVVLLAGFDLSNTWFPEETFHRQLLFVSVNLKNSIFRGTWRKAHLIDSDLSDSDMGQMDLSGCLFERCDTQNCKSLQPLPEKSHLASKQEPCLEEQDIDEEMTPNSCSLS